MTTFAAAATDSQTWVVTGVRNCDIYGCSQDAAIIADTCNYARFCLTHAAAAIGIALRDPMFNGWYRITAGHYDDTRHCLIVTVHPL
ncbi:hypothetical protein [Mycolicibacterium tusciae]|uniref:hypothetical protein n=1 Tax=Mycolicibacterium tusciae TaxID=75922 RepID=UPI00024A46F8|nr:hypothetical protein [Mycolicibacterium tusciae]